MDQRDPNTVSGLLKLHLREHPFLCVESVAKLDEVLQDGNWVSKPFTYKRYPSDIFSTCA